MVIWIMRPLTSLFLRPSSSSACWILDFSLQFSSTSAFEYCFSFRVLSYRSSLSKMMPRGISRMPLGSPCALRCIALPQFPCTRSYSIRAREKFSTISGFRARLLPHEFRAFYLTLLEMWGVAGFVGPPRINGFRRMNCSVLALLGLRSDGGAVIRCGYHTRFWIYKGDGTAESFAGLALGTFKFLPPFVALPGFSLVLWHTLRGRLAEWTVS